MTYRIGIDIGSKTIKMVVLDESGSVLHKAYRRHRADIRQTMDELLHDMIWRYGDITGDIAVTGSAGIELAQSIGLPFTQEVIATTHAVQTFIPQADAIIELGGEDAKVMYLTGGLEQRMNATCAGGTGGFIDTIAFRLGARAQDMSSLAMRANRLYPIASRCAVFAESDVRPLLNAGARREDIAASVLDAVVRQTLGGLACGRPITGTVVFLGGPLEHIPYLVFRFREALKLNYETGVKPWDAHLFTAIGTALLAPEFSHRMQLSFSELQQRVAAAPRGGDELIRLPRLFESSAEHEAFKERHAQTAMPRIKLFDARGFAYLGIDAGSTTVKLALLDEQDRLIYSDYRPTKGDVLATAADMLGEMYRSLPHEYNEPDNFFVRIMHTTVTGYGEDLLRAAFSLDSGIVETNAHLLAAQHLQPDVSFVLDIGGQDIKALWVKDGVIDDAILNEACSSGCGSFIEGIAYSLRSTPYSFSDIACVAQSPIDLGIKCTVFMTSRVRHAQKIGANYGDIAGGLAYSVVKNALFKIIGMQNIDSIGDHVVVQGGTFMSDAVLRAFELVSGKEVMRLDTAHLAGAIGAALAAHARADGTGSTLIAPTQLTRLNPRRRIERCPGCQNACPVTIVTFFDDESKGAETTNAPQMFISGNRCDKALSFFSGETYVSAHSHRVSCEKPPNLYQLERQLLMRYEPEGSLSSDKRTLAHVASDLEENTRSARGMISVGIPRSLHLYESLPFWHTLLSTLGFTVIVPRCPDEPATGGMNYTRSGAGNLETVFSESVCYAAKITHTQIAELLEEGVGTVFMPQFDRGSRCPVSSLYAQAVGENIPPFVSGNTRFVAPILRMIRPDRIAGDEKDRWALFSALQAIAPGQAPLFADEFDRAVDVATQEYARFVRTLQEATEHAFAWIEEHQTRGIVLAGRPYHVDATLSHGIDILLQELGFAVFSPLGLSARIDEHRKAVREQEEAPLEWRSAKTLAMLARFAASEPSLDLVCLYSFGCSFDAVGLDIARDILKAAGKSCTAFKIDEIVDLAHIRIRLRTLAEVLQGGYPGLSFLESCEPVEPACEKLTQKRSKILRVQGITQTDIDCARAYVNPDVCFVASALAGHIVSACQEDPAIGRVVVPDVCSDCVTGALPDLVRHALGWSPEIVFEDHWLGVVPVRTCDVYDAPEAFDAAQKAQACIGILGNALFCFDETMNRGIARIIEDQGFSLVFPEEAHIVQDDVRYLEQIRSFRAQGVNHVIYLQAFGCLKGHVSARGALRELQRSFPDLRLTIIDYDADTSALNQENRILLALEAARREPSSFDS